MAAITRPAESSSPHLRPFDVRRDLNAVADLVELCFADTIDADGKRYIQQMRSAARSPSYLLWAAAVADRVPLPLTGFVWVENNYLAGNLSLIPFNSAGRRIYLIANVAVDPAYRRRGIARALTNAAMEYIRERGADSVWLHVREENQAAFNLYSSLGFEERSRRTTWESLPGGSINLINNDYPELSNITITRRHPIHWSQQRKWLKRVFPPEISWHMTFNPNVLRPGLLGTIHRLLTGTTVRQWAAVREKHLIGVISWQLHQYRSDKLWLATAPEVEDIAVRALLFYLQHKLHYRRELSLEYPGGHAVQAFKEAGFTVHQTLIWMEIELE